MKVACIGNMNNTFFSLVRYLRDRGIDADLLLLDDDADHFHPSADAFDTSFQNYTKQLSWGRPVGFSSTSKKQIYKDLNGYDFLIACGSVPAFVNKVGLSIDLLIPYGGDIFFYPFFDFKNPIYQLRCLFFTKQQRLGIQKSAALSWDLSNDASEEIIDRLKYPGKRFTFGIPTVYTPLYNPDTIEKYYSQSEQYPAFKQIREDHDLMVFHHSRQVWEKSPDRFSWKGNDQLFQGFANFLKTCRDLNPCIVTFEYGPDVASSKRLIQDLGIEKNVYWFPKMSRKEIMVGLSLSDIGTGEFHMSWLSCGTIYETLAMAKPLMHFREDHLYEGHFPELYPMMHARTAEDISKGLHDYVARPKYYREMGGKGRIWLQSIAIDPAIKSYVQMMMGRQ